MNYKEIHPLDLGAVINELPENAELIVHSGSNEFVEILIRYRLTVYAPIITEEGKRMAKSCGLKQE